MTSVIPTVYVVDDDPSIRKALGRLFTSVGLRSETFASAQDLMRHPFPPTPGCLVLDVRLPGLSGLESQRMLADLGVDLPIIFITGHGDIPMTVQAMKAGAVDFLTKPTRDQDLLDAVQQAIERHTLVRQQRGDQEVIGQRISLLTAREQEVLALVVRGLINKQIARRLGVSEKTIKVHRARVMEKMEADTLPDLVRMAEKAGLAEAEP